MIRPSLLAFPLIAACFSSTLPEYEQARARALAPPPPLTDDWQPDAALLLSQRAMSTLTHALLASHGRLDQPISLGPLGRAVPDLQVVSARIGPSKACATCVQITASLDGTVRTEGVAALSSPLAATLAADLEIDGRADRDAFVLTARVRDVSQVEIGRLAAPEPVRRALASTLTEAARRHLLADGKPITLARLPSETLPVRAVRTSTSGSDVRVDLRTAAASSAVLPPITTPTRSGFVLAIAQDTLLALARAEAMRQGPVSYDVVPEPTGLRMVGEAFELDLRLWKTTGSGWWRDYTVRGTMTRSKAGLDMAPTTVQEVASSPGAAVADPLAALGASVIFQTIRESMQVTAPAVHRTELGAAGGLDVTIATALGRATAVEVTGSITTTPAKPQGPAGATRSGR